MTSLSTPNAPVQWDTIPHMPFGSVPDNLPDEQPLLYRQIIAKRALVAAYEEPSEIAQTISDALADLRHLVDALGLDFATLERSAYDSYLRERAAAQPRG